MEIRKNGKSERKGVLNNKRITGMSVSCFFTLTSGFPGLLAILTGKECDGLCDGLRDGLCDRLHDRLRDGLRHRLRDRLRDG